MTTRDEKILAGMPQVRLIAARIYRRLPKTRVSLQFRDLVSIGTIGLIAAVDRFDDTAGTELKTYAEHKIRGAILDALRSVDPCSRASRVVRRRAEQAIHTLTQQLGRTPTDHEVAAALELPVERYRAHMDAAHTEFVNLDYRPANSAQRASDLVPDPSPSPEQQATWRALERALGRLTPREREVLQLSFYEGLPNREIAQRLGVHESRISQLRKSAIRRIRLTLAIRVAPNRRGSIAQQERRARERAAQFSPALAA